MQFVPLAHGASGIFDEVLLVIEAALALFVIVYFIRTRKKDHPNPSASATHPSKNDLIKVDDPNRS